MANERELQLIGVRENNLRNLRIEIPHDQLVVISGISGSGKSTLAFDTIYAEGQRRYVETFSPYTRQFLERLKPPLLDSASGVRPALALEQRSRITNSRSTVGTVTEVNDFLKVIWAQLALLHCPKCNLEVRSDTPLRVLKASVDQASTGQIQHAVISFPIKITEQITAQSLSSTLKSEGFIRFFRRSTKMIERMENLSAEDIVPGSVLLVVTSRISLPGPAESYQFTESAEREFLTVVRQAFHFGKGRLHVLYFTDRTGEAGDLPLSAELSFSQELVCEQCKTLYPRAKSAYFSFNTPLGACPTCKGFGKTLAVDPTLLIPDENKSIDEGALAVWNTPSTKHELRTLKKACREHGIDTSAPWNSLDERAKELIFQGVKGPTRYRGIKRWFERLQRKVYKMHVRVFLSRFRREFTCAECNGNRIRSHALAYRIEGKTIADIWRSPLSELLPFFLELQHRYGADESVAPALSELVNRLRYLVDINLDYLTLDRQSRTLSGGESQRVNLATILGSELVNTMLILDEPSVGLHARDTGRLLTTLRLLRDRGNSIIVVEHDPDIIAAADQVIDLGPGAGEAGGEVVFQGPVAELFAHSQSLTSNCLTKPKPNETAAKLPIPKQHLQIIGATANNLKSIDVAIPLERFVVITGVSGSGKSSLVNDSLYGNYLRLKQGSRGIENGTVAELRGLEFLDDIVLIDQSPIGKTPRSNAATYTGSWELIRQCLANTKGAEQLGFSKSSFSFNVDGGRCPACKGAGCNRIEMQFLADVFVVCEECNGERFQRQVLEVEYHGKSVSDLLKMSLHETVDFFSRVESGAVTEKIIPLVQPLLDLGLGYLRLGQPLSTVSGGEAQRIKLASYLSARENERLMFILDEPTTGLHLEDISRLLTTLRRLVAAGHSVLVIEHNLACIAQADWLIDIGPEGGEAGGRVIATGVPAELLANAQAVERSYTLQELNRAQHETRSNEAGKSKVHAVPVRSEAAIKISGARHHNLKNISLEIPKKKITVVTGVSGSGKSSLAFDVLSAEGQRRYIDSLSPYARQYLTQLTRAEVDSVSSIPPTIALAQKTAPPLGVSTIATTTEIYQFLRLLFARIGLQHCPEHGLPITRASAESVCDEIIERFGDKRIFLFAPVVSGRKGYYNDLFRRAIRADINEARIDGRVTYIATGTRLERHKPHWISLLVASLGRAKISRDLLSSAIEQCLAMSGGTVELAVTEKNAKPIVFSSERVCPSCKQGFPKLDPQDFSFRSTRGACKRCGGYGTIGERSNRQRICPACNGERIEALGRNVFLGEKNIAHCSHFTAPQLLEFLSELSFSERLEPVVQPIMFELKHRLRIIEQIGLGYLSLDRESASLSAGEAQRLRLARTLGSPLTGVCYVLDEPTVGLHPRDHDQLLETLRHLRDSGNTIVVVEHDERTILAADHLIDMGPGGGANGGHIVAAGNASAVIATQNSLTGQALRERSNFNTVSPSKTRRIHSAVEHLELTGACANNLKNVSARFPLRSLSVVTGVSGAGKSSLIHQCLIPAISEVFAQRRRSLPNKTWLTLSGHKPLERFIEIDQSPVGKTSTSNPASYLGVFSEIRQIFAMLPEAKARGWTASHFSFNTGGGRCRGCSGKGSIRIPMSFLPDAVTVCEECGGKRYDDPTLEILYQGHSISDVLNLTLSEARTLFTNHPKVYRPLDRVLQLGLGYLTLGQPTYTLSGGETQRLKIARELGTSATAHTLYILDEPTTGLHMLDVERLLNVLRQLVAQGGTVIVIEHDLDFIRGADYLVELGPGPGEQGGKIIFAGSPMLMMKRRAETPTRDFLVARQHSSDGKGEWQKAINERP